MKHKVALAAAAITTALLSTASTLQAADLSTNYGFSNGIKLYGGVGAGYTVQGNACNTPFFDGACDEGASGYKVFGGTRFNPMLGAEIAYIEQGKAELNGSVGTLDVASSNKLSGYQISGVGYLPLSPQVVPNLEVIGKAGAMFWQRETETQISNTSNATKDDGISPLLGIGAQYQFHQNMYLRGEWEHTFSTGADSDFETDTDNYSMSLMYSTF